MSEELEQFRSAKQDAAHEALAKFIGSVGELSDRERLAFELGFIAGAKFGIQYGSDSTLSVLLGRNR